MIIGAAENPCVKIFKGNEYTGLAFHGQQLDGATLNEIKSVNRKVTMKISVALTFTMRPELVTAAQKIATVNSLITAEIFDINHFAALKKVQQLLDFLLSA